MKHIYLFLFLLLASAVHSQTIKLKVTGVTDAAGEDVIAFETSDTLAINPGGGGGGATVGVPRFEVAKIKKLRGTSTNELFRRSAGGVATPDFTFEFYNASNTLYYTISIKNVYVTHFSYLSPECNGCSTMYHQLWLYYDKIEWTDVATGNTTRFDILARKFY